MLFIHILKHELRKHYKSDLGGRRNQRQTMVRNIVLLSFIHKVSVKHECRVLAYRIWLIMSDHIWMISLINKVCNSTLLYSVMTFHLGLTSIMTFHLGLTSIISEFVLLSLWYSTYWLWTIIYLLVLMIIVLFVLISTASHYPLCIYKLFLQSKWLAIK